MEEGNGEGRARVSNGVRRETKTERAMAASNANRQGIDVYTKVTYAFLDLTVGPSCSHT